MGIFRSVAGRADDLLRFEPHFYSRSPGATRLPDREIPADERFLTEDYPRIVRFRAGVDLLRDAIRTGAAAEKTVKELLSDNPCYFGAWDACGDYFAARDEADQARTCWKQALRLEIPRVREAIEQKLNRL